MEVEFEVTVDGSKFQASDKQFRSRVQVGKGLNSTVFKVAATAVQQQQKKDDDDDKTASSINLALKLSVDEEADKRIKAEAKAMREVNEVSHPFLLPLLLEREFGEEKRHGLVTVFVDRSLRDVIKDTDYRQAGPGDKLIPIACSVLRGVAHIARRKKVHQDIKPENILVHSGKKGGDVKAFVIDLDSITSAEEKHVPGKNFGTQGFQSPELAIGAERVTSAADMFSTGATLASLITGEDIFRIEGSDGKTKQSQCRRVLDSMSAVLGPIPDSALTEMNVALSDEDKPEKTASEETALKGRLSKSRLNLEEQAFFLGLLVKCLDYSPSCRPTAFEAFRLVYPRATEEQKEAMDKFTKEEKAEAEEMCGGKELAEKNFSKVF